MLRALVLGLAFALMAFGVFLAWFAFRRRKEGRDALAWGLAAGGVNIAVGATVVLGVLRLDAWRYAAAAFAVLAAAKFAARRRLARS